MRKESSFELDPYVVDVLLPDLVGHDRHPSAFLIYIHLWRRTNGGERRSGPQSLATLAENTGLSKRAVQAALERLLRRQLIHVHRATATAVPEFEIRKPWLRSAKR